MSTELTEQTEFIRTNPTNLTDEQTEFICMNPTNLTDEQTEFICTNPTNLTDAMGIPSLLHLAHPVSRCLQ